MLMMYRWKPKCSPANIDMHEWPRLSIKTVVSDIRQKHLMFITLVRLYHLNILQADQNVSDSF